MFLLKRLNAVDFFRFSQLLVEVKNAKNEICIISHLIQYGGYRVEKLHKTILGKMPSNT